MLTTDVLRCVVGSLTLEKLIYDPVEVENGFSREVNQLMIQILVEFVNVRGVKVQIEFICGDE